MGLLMDVVDEGIKQRCGDDMRVFVFSENFDFDSRSILSCQKGIFVFWALGKTVPMGFFDIVINNQNVLYISGNMSGLMNRFLCKVPVRTSWSKFFDRFLSNSSMSGVIENRDIPSLGLL